MLQSLSTPQLSRDRDSTETILWLRERFGWMGSHSGYDQLCAALQANHTGKDLNVWRTKRNNKLSNRLFRWIHRYTQASPFYNTDSAMAELLTFWRAAQQNPALIHLTYVENQLGLLPKRRSKLTAKLIGTCHQPSSWWRLAHRHADSLKALDAVIVLANQEIPYFQQFLGDQVYFVPHGVDTAFFHPAPEATSEPPRFVFSGSWLRDLRTLSVVIDEVLARDPAVGFDMVVPRSKRTSDYFYRIARHPQVAWHAGISDSQLRQLYQRARALVLPLIDCTANNALLEAIACGLPIISNDTGGIRDYTDPSFATLVNQGDVDGFTSEILELAASSRLRQERGRKARQFAEKTLAWPHVAQTTFNVYTRVTSL